jgi:hypothetical protein
MSSRFIVVPAALVAALLVPGLAHAQECASSADCPAGLSCQSSLQTVCSAAACSTTDPVCPEPTCVEQTVASCQPMPCTADAACPAGMVCEAQVYEECSGGEAACAPNMECPAPEPPVCNTVTGPSLCTPTWLLPCQAAADCGPGFACVPEESCACSGSVGVPTPGAAGSAGFVPPDPTCTCTPTGVNRCEPAEVTCAADADCLAGWTCVETSSGDVSCAAPDPAGAAGAPACPPPAPAVKQCVPPYYQAVTYGGTVGIDESTGGWPLLTGTAGGAPVVPPAAENSGTSDSSTDQQGGCQMASGHAPAGAWLLALIGLLAIGRRK